MDGYGPELLANVISFLACEHCFPFLSNTVNRQKDRMTAKQITLVAELINAEMFNLSVVYSPLCH